MMPQPLQGKRGDAVAGRRGIVVPGLGTVDQDFVVVGGEEETAGVAVFEAIQQGVGQFNGEAQVFRAKLGLHQFEQGGEQEGVVVEIGVEAGAAVPGGRQQMAPTPRPPLTRG
jgi:hypothetical protein